MGCGTMGFTSILDLIEVEEEVRMKRPTFFLDLNIDQIVDSIQDKNSQYDLRRLFWYFPKNQECEEYRRQVYADIKQEPIYEGLNCFSKTLQKMRVFLENKENVEFEIQKNICQVEAVGAYVTGILQLKTTLQEHLRSKGFQNLKEYLDTYSQTTEYEKLEKEVLGLVKELDDLRLIITIENNKVEIKEGSLDGSYEKKLEGLFTLGEYELQSPFVGELNFGYLEEEIFAAVKKKKGELFEKIDKVAEASVDFADEVILRFEKEVQYYLSYRMLQKDMESSGYHFGVPEESIDGTMSGEGVYDLALALVNRRYGQPVIDNSFSYGDGEKFFVLNGPNQGGKTTFARSLGQLVYFAKMGLDVPAKAVKLPYYDQIATHFSVEESMETGRGKLMEELVRLKPMMENESDNLFVVINELFTTAANYDAYVMGSKVLEFFIEKGCRGIYVTHIHELTKAHEGIVSLRALLEDGDYHKRTYKIVRGDAEEQGYAGDIVEKYELTYEQLKARFDAEHQGGGN